MEKKKEIENMKNIKLQINILIMLEKIIPIGAKNFQKKE